MRDLKIYVGYDPREDLAYEVCRHSILTRTPGATVYPIKKTMLEKSGWYWRPVDRLSSTEFTFTRFLVPALTHYRGWALFIDCDTLLQTDLNELFDLTDDKYAVMVVKHDYTPLSQTKMDGRLQTVYPRKNWSSVMLFNCEHPSNKVLTKELVSDTSKDGGYFHRFNWLQDDEIGELHHEWNWLVGHYYKHDGLPKLIHYTEGGPWFKNYFMQDLSDVWKDEYQQLMEREFTIKDTVDK